MAGVEGSPPPGMEATIPFWKRRAGEFMKRSDAAERALSSLQGALRGYYQGVERIRGEISIGKAVTVNDVYAITDVIVRHRPAIEKFASGATANGEGPAEITAGGTPSKGIESTAGTDDLRPESK